MRLPFLPAGVRHILPAATFLACLMPGAAQTSNEAAATPPASAPATTTDDEKLLDEVQHKAFEFFWNEANPDNGLIRDRASNTDKPSKNKNVASIASVGFGLSAYVVGAERGWIKREEAVARTKATLNAFLQNVEGKNGFFYHFVDMRSGKRAWNSELSSIDSALLLSGMLLAKEYYQDPEISKAVDQLYANVDFEWMRNNQPFLSMGWSPEKGFLTTYWSNYNEGILLDLLAIGSPTHPLDPKVWHAVRRKVGQYKEHILVSCPPLFTHQYPQLWIDLRDKNDGKMDYFRNSREATLANREFCMDQAGKYKSYGENSWGLTACDGPFGYKAYGSPPGKPLHDGTIGISGAIGSILFTPEFSKAAIRYFRGFQDLPLWGKYGFANSFNVDRKWTANDVIGIDQGAIVLAIENHRSGLIWQTMMKNEAVQTAMKRIGFRPGTIELQLEQQPQYAAARAAGPVRVDGDLADWRANAPIIVLDPLHNLETGAIENDQDLSSDFKLMWDDQYLYLSAAVKDDEVVSRQNGEFIWRDDCIEIFIDPAGTGLIWADKKSFQIGLAPGAPHVAPQTWAWFQKRNPGSDQSVLVAKKDVEGGYILEAAIAWKFLGLEPREGLTFGFSPALHDRDETNKSEGKLMWYFEDVSGKEGKQLGAVQLVN